MTTTAVDVVSGVSGLPIDAWDRLAGPENFFLSSGWLAVVEATSGAEIRYLLDGLLDAGLATAVATPPSPWLSGRPDTLLDRAVRERWPGSLALRAKLPDDLAAALLPGIVCGGRHLGRTRPLLAGDRGDEEARIGRLVHAAEELADRSAARSVSFLYVDERDLALRTVLTERGYDAFESGRYSWLPVPAGGLTEHVAGLSAHRARRIRAEIRQLAGAGVVSDIEPLSAGLIPRLAELEAQLLRKYGMDWSAAQSAAVLVSILEHLGAHALLSTVRIDRELVGFGLILRHHDQWYAHRAGFDYAAQGPLPLYFQALYYGPIDAAAAAGIRTIHYGTGSVEAKRARGCRSTGQFSYLRSMRGDR
ncbi:MAG TPA: GNAT family N-acetyltransferase [Nakamurella sp.]